MRAVLCLLPALWLGGCGFALRGTGDLPDELRTLRLESREGGSEIVREVRRMLTASGVTLAEENAPDLYRLGIGREQIQERVLSVNANARAGEYELTLSVPFQLVREDRSPIPPETLTISRFYLADPNNAVAKQEEVELLREEMRRELANRILRRLQTVEL